MITIEALQACNTRLDQELTYLRTRIAEWRDHERCDPAIRAEMREALHTVDDLDVPVHHNPRRDEALAENERLRDVLRDIYRGGPFGDGFRLTEAQMAARAGEALGIEENNARKP